MSQTIKTITGRDEYNMAHEWAIENGYENADHAFSLLGLHEALRLMDLPSFRTVDDVLLLGGNIPRWARQYHLYTTKIAIREAEEKVERLQYGFRKLLDWQPD